MLQVKNINILQKTDLRYLIRELSFTLNAGDKAALIGEEGNGKSTLLKLIYREELTEEYIEYSGEIVKNKEVLGYLSQERLAKKERSEYEKQQERLRRIQQKVEHQQNIISRQNPHGGQLLKKKMHAVKSMERRIERETANRTQVPDTEEAIFFRLSQEERIPRGKRILEYRLERLSVEGKCLAENIRLDVTGPEKICIVGKNGVGKTTLLKELAKELLERRDLRAAYMPQNYEDLLEFEKNPVDYLTQTGAKEEITRIRTFLGSMKYTSDEMEHSITQLSGGQKAKLFMLKMSLDSANVLILDEPTRNFSPLSSPVIREHLEHFEGAIISISHDRKFIRQVCERVYELNCTGLHLLE